MNINWSLIGAPVDVGAHFQEGMQRGRALRMQGQQDSALAALAQDPANESALAGLTAVNPQLGMQARQSALGAAQARTRQQIGQRAAAGDMVGARTAALESGDIDYAAKIAHLSQERRAEIAEAANTLTPIYHKLRAMPYEERRTYLQSIAPSLVARGISEEIVANYDPSDTRLEADIALGTKVAAERKLRTVNPGDVVIDEATNEAVYTSPYAPTVTADGVVYERLPNGTGGASSTAATGDVFQALIQQESGGRAGIPGPVTEYGQPMGMTQMLPETAREMAQKLGLPWRPELMAQATPEAAEYQTRLGRAYFDEGLAKYGGDTRKALMYYHGGPDERLWGPKTRAYADQVLTRTGRGGGPRRVNSAQEFASLASGTEFIAPDGTVRRKP